jgi:hypothetical protein
MKKIYILIILLSAILFISCDSDNEVKMQDSDLLTGNWINPVAVDTLMKYERADTLKSNDYGFSFKEGQKFVERKNAGWCGTPPISYADFEGTWSVNDSVISITVDYWGGVANYEWKIINIDNNFLTVYVLKEEYQYAD